MKISNALILLASVLIAAGACAAPTSPPASTPMATNTATATVQSTATPQPTPTPTVPPTQPTEIAQPSGGSEIELKPVIAGGLTRPDYLTHAGDDRLFVVEQPGRIRIIKNGQLLDQPFLDITDKVTTDGNEQGLLSVAFHPDLPRQRTILGKLHAPARRRDDHRALHGFQG